MPPQAVEPVRLRIGVSFSPPFSAVTWRSMSYVGVSKPSLVETVEAINRKLKSVSRLAKSGVK